MKYTRLFSLITVISGLLLLSACTGVMSWGMHTHNDQISTPTSNYAFERHGIEGDAEDYLSMARSAAGPEKQGYLLSAAQLLIEGREVSPAAKILADIPPSELTPAMAAQRHILMARVDLLERRPQAALHQLQQIRQPSQFSAMIQINHRKASAMAYQQLHNPLNAVRQYIALDDLLMQDEAIEANQQALWDTLQDISTSQTRVLADQAFREPLKGWLALSAIAQQTDHGGVDFTNRLGIWRKQHPRHPANRFLTRFRGSSEEAVSQAAQTPRHIALLLPLAGPLAGAGEAVRNGFFAAYRQDHAQNRGVDIKVFDTSQGEISSIYQQAINEGADFVVGPLSKEAIASLSNSTHFKIPTLALNNVDGIDMYQSQLLQFGLSPSDEALQAVQRAWEHNYHRAVIIAPDNPWGQSIAQTFMSRWEELDGELVANLAFSNQRQVNQEIHQLLGVADSERRQAVLQNILKEKVRSVPRRRHDIDVIFLAAQPYQARQIRPLLKFYYGGNIPVYATSSVYSGYPSPQKDNDLNGIAFCDAPWVIEAPEHLAPWLQTLRQQMITLWPDSFKQYSRFYGFGIDAYRIMTGLPHLTALPHFGIDGATGRLYLAKDRHIYRRLEWAQIRSGVPKMLPKQHG